MSDAADTFLRRRRAAVAAHATQIGIDFVEVEADPVDGQPYRLVLHWIPAGSHSAKHGALGSLTRDNLRFTAGGVSVDGLFTLKSDALHLPNPRHPATDLVTVDISFASDSDLARRLGHAPVFTLELVGVANLDPFFSRVDFSLDPASPLDLDCTPACSTGASATSATSASGPALASNYLAKDYASFRQRMLDDLAQALPDWQERSPADLQVALVELLADAADQASYYQDAVATEAYLGTARLRISARRHARLVGYAIEDGNNARTWVQLMASATGPDGVSIAPGTQLLTRVPGTPVLLAPGSPEYLQALAAGPTVFETLQPLQVWRAHDAIPLYDWGAPDFVLPAGATGATLKGALPHLAPGDVLILEELRGLAAGQEAPDPEHRHAVRLTRVQPAADPVASPDPGPLTAVEWQADDALPFTLSLTTTPAGGTPVSSLSIARGNVALADHGRTVGSDEALTATAGRFRPRLGRTGLTHRQPYDHAAAQPQPAAAALTQSPAAVLPVIDLRDDANAWTLRGDLLSSDRFARDYVVEMEDDGTAVLRFGDGVLGRPPAPGTVLHPVYRVGNGRTGNLGRDSLYHVVSGTAVAAVRNPLPALGGSDPEPLDRIRLAAPGTLRALQGSTSELDFVALAMTHPEVELATASLRWTGSWYVLEVAVQRRGGLPVDDEFAARLRDFLESSRLAGWELAITGLSFVGLDVALTAFLDPGAAAGAVEQALLAAFSNRDLPGGAKGFFHPDNFSLGQPVYLSRIVAAALEVPGVVALDTDDTPPKPNRFRRFGEPSRGELDTGQIRLRGTEIARVDNDPAAPQNGRIQFFLEGGR
jgi:hypothetical protein